MTTDDRSIIRKDERRKANKEFADWLQDWMNEHSDLLIGTYGRAEIIVKIKELRSEGK